MSASKKYIKKLFRNRNKHSHKKTTKCYECSEGKMARVIKKGDTSEETLVFMCDQCGYMVDLDTYEKTGFFLEGHMTGFTPPKKESKLFSIVPYVGKKGDVYVKERHILKNKFYELDEKQTYNPTTRVLMDGDVPRSTSEFQHRELIVKITEQLSHAN